MSGLGKAPASVRVRWFAVGALAIAGAAIGLIAAGGLGRNLVYYWSPSELLRAGDKANGATIRLGGQVAPGSIRPASEGSTLEFAVTDGTSTVPVVTQGVPPQMFREGIGVVVEGAVGADGRFQGSRLMVSHGNEYRAPKPGEATDVRQMMKSLQEGDGSQGK